MASKKDLSKVITKLNRLTQEGKITWDRIDPPKGLITGTDDHIINFYTASYKSKNIGLYEERYQDYAPDYDTFYWTERTVLAFFSSDMVKAWAFPALAGVYELKESVEYQVSDVDVFVSEFLGDNEKET